MTDREQAYLGALLAPLVVTRNYRPLLGQARPQSPADFAALYGADPLYRAAGLDAPAVYAAHRVAGGMTSVYRQLGLGARQLARAVLRDAFGIPEGEATWVARGQDLGCLVPVVPGRPRYAALRAWTERVGRGSLGLAIEVRQGMKTGDARRQHSYVEANAADARGRGRRPVLMLFSNQAHERAIEGYRDAGWWVLRGDPQADEFAGTFAFFREVAGFDLAGFLEANHAAIAARVGGVVAGLLAP